MTEFRTLVNELKEMDAENKLHSKVTTNRNWGIQLFTSLDTGERIAEAGKWSSLIHVHRLSEIKEMHLRTFAFTYKKDFKEMLKIIEETGMKIFESSEF